MTASAATTPAADPDARDPGAVEQQLVGVAGDALDAGFCGGEPPQERLEGLAAHPEVRGLRRRTRHEGELAAAVEQRLVEVGQPRLEQVAAEAAQHVRQVELHDADPVPGEAADVLWTFNDPALYDRLVNRAGWTKEQYAAWLRQLIPAQVLVPEPAI